MVSNERGQVLRWTSRTKAVKGIAQKDARALYIRVDGNRSRSHRMWEMIMGGGDDRVWYYALEGYEAEVVLTQPTVQAWKALDQKLRAWGCRYHLPPCVYS